MVRRDRFIGFALCLLGVSSLACAGDDHGARSFAAVAPMHIPHAEDLELDYARLLTPELRRTPVVGWLAENLYRNKKDNGWCLEIDPGEGEYTVFYRVHLR